jgi:hypothetical protein
LASNFWQAAVSAGIILVRSRISGNRHVCRAAVRCAGKCGESYLFLEPFRVRIIGKSQAPPTKNKDHRNILRPEVLDYFKGLAEETELSYQELISLYLLDCAKKRKKSLRRGPTSRELSLLRRKSAYSDSEPLCLAKTRCATPVKMQPCVSSSCATKRGCRNEQEAGREEETSGSGPSGQHEAERRFGRR